MDEQSGRPPRRQGYWNAKRVAQLIALLFTAVAAIAVLFVPSYTTATSDSDGTKPSEAAPCGKSTGPSSCS